MSTIKSEPALQVSVVIPAYNVGPYISRTLISALAQSRPADEIIVVDDGSTDDTADIVRSFGSKVQLIRQTNAGASAARNTGILAAKHPWIAFLDGDDQWLAQNLELQMGLLQRNPQLKWVTANFLRCYCRRDERIENLQNGTAEKARLLLKEKEYFESYFEAFADQLPGCTNTMVVKKESLQAAGLFRTDQARHNDEDMWFKLAYRHPQVGFNPDPLAIYHMEIPKSIAETCDGPENLELLLSRHLELSRRHGYRNEFKLCAGKLLQYWLSRYLFNGQVADIREIVVRFNKILPSKYRAIMRLLTMYPHLTAACIPLVSRWKRSIPL